MKMLALLISLLCMACHRCPDDEVLFLDEFDDCGDLPCGWSVEPGGTVTGVERGLLLADGATAHRAVAVEFGRNDVWSVESRVRCEPGASVRFEATGPQAVELTVRDSSGDETVRVDIRPEEYGLFYIDEFTFTSVDGACTIEGLRALAQSYCD